MAEDRFKNLLFGSILTSLFAVLILTAVVNVGQDYDKDTDEIAEGTLSLAGFNDSVSAVNEDAENLRERFEKQSIWSGVAGIVVTGIFDIGKAMILMIILPFNLLSSVITNVIGIPSIVTNTILGLLIISLILALWSLLKNAT